MCMHDYTSIKKWIEGKCILSRYEQHLVGSKRVKSEGLNASIFFWLRLYASENAYELLTSFFKEVLKGGVRVDGRSRRVSEKVYL